MKKSFLIAYSLVLASVGTSYAQTDFDALNYSSTDIIGTARYMGMGGAMGALGGDPSSYNINPAGLGVNRSFEIAITSGVNINNTTAKWDGNSMTENKTHVPFNQFSFVFGFTNKKKTKGVISCNFGVTYNKLKDFNRTLTAKAYNQSSSMTDYLAGFTNQRNLYAADIRDLGNFENLNNAYLSSMAYNTYLLNPNDDSTAVLSPLNDGETVDPTYMSREKGYLNEWSIAWGMNVSNKVYVGLSLGVQNLYYNRESYYSETFADGGDMLIREEQETKAVGFNFNAGVIYRPVDMLRLGVAVHSPTFFNSSGSDYGVDDYLSSSMTANLEHSNFSRPNYNIDNYYELQTPWRYNFSAAVVLGHRGLFSLDYQIIDYNTMRLREDNGGSFSFETENDNIKNNLKASHSLRAGLEFNVAKGLFARCGYAFTTTPFENKDKVIKELPYNTTYTNPEFMVYRWTNYYSVGLGYRWKHVYLDLAYQLKHNQSDLYAYDYSLSDYGDVALNKAKVNSLVHNIILSAGFKF